LLSGSAPGETYLFRGQMDKSFGTGEKLLDPNGKVVAPGQIATAFAADWDDDRRLDLVLGNVSGEVHVARNVSSGGRVRFEQPTKVDLDDPREDKRDSAPVLADWDSDGRFDLVVGMEDGSVYLFRNNGAQGKPAFNRGECLVPLSPLAARNDNSRGPHDCGQRTKVCVADYNDDGRPDLLVGDMGGSFDAKPEQTPSEVEEERAAVSALPDLRKSWVEAFAAFRKLSSNKSTADRDVQKQDEAIDSKRAELLNRVTDLKTKIDTAETAVKRYEKQQQIHGHVWVYLRKPVKSAVRDPLAKRETE
jgi:hypothetical protein